MTTLSIISEETKQLTARQKLKQLMEFSGIGSKFKIVDITLGAKTAENLHESVIFCNLDEKDLYLYYFVKSYKVGFYLKSKSFL